PAPTPPPDNPPAPAPAEANPPCAQPAEPGAQISEPAPPQPTEPRRPAPAPAQPRPAEAPPPYPGPFLDRPLVLPPSIWQPELRSLVVDQDKKAVRTLLSAGVDGSPLDSLQVGALATFQAGPTADFRSLLVNAQYPTLDEISMRLDAGIARTVTAVTMPNLVVVNQVEYEFVGGAGLPFKHTISSHLALTSGSPTSFRWPDGILTWEIKSSGSSGKFGLPLGLLWQLHPRVAAELRSGFRMDVAVVRVATYVPLTFEVMGHLGSRFDAGASFEMPGDTNNYTVTRAYQLWALGRF